LTVGGRLPKHPSVRQLTSRPDSVLSKCRRSRHPIPTQIATAPRPVSRETLLQEIWGYNSGLTTHTLETHIYRLRQKIEKDAASPAILVTQAGGYTLVP
jgi:Transcriptional regulatory protein, C terminal